MSGCIIIGDKRGNKGKKRERKMKASIFLEYIYLYIWFLSRTASYNIRSRY